jgi:hypothetical protein
MELNRRAFLGSLVAGVAGIALDKAIPLGRVWSFPSKIVVPAACDYGALVHRVFRRHSATVTVNLEVTHAADFAFDGAITVADFWRVDPQRRVLYRREYFLPDGTRRCSPEELTPYTEIPYSRTRNDLFNNIAVLTPSSPLES